METSNNLKGRMDSGDNCTKEEKKTMQGVSTTTPVTRSVPTPITSSVTTTVTITIKTPVTLKIAFITDITSTPSFSKKAFLSPTPSKQTSSPQIKLHSYRNNHLCPPSPSHCPLFTLTSQAILSVSFSIKTS